MALRVTARLAQRLGTMAPNHTPKGGTNNADATPGPEEDGDSSAQQCKAKCAVRASVLPAKTAWNWGLVFSRCTFRPHQEHTPVQLECARAADYLSQCLDGQTLTTLGAAGVDHSATATGLHADQKAMGTCAADFGWLVSAFHLEFLANSIQIQLH